VVAQAAAIPPARRLYLYEAGAVQVVRDDDARVAGYDVIDLSDDWVPYIFTEQTPGKDDHAPNDYRKTYVDLANDRTDEDGKPLPAGEHNYVELFGIPPSLSVVRKRFLDDSEKACFGKLHSEVLRGYRGAVTYEGGKASRAILDRYSELRKEVQRKLKTTGAGDVGALKKNGQGYLAKQYRLYQTKVAVIDQAHQRMLCEGLYPAGESPRKLIFDHEMHQALARYERKHMIYGYGQLYGQTLRVLGRSPLQNNWETLKRVITERVVHSLGIIEDGSAPAADEAGGKKASGKGPNLVADYTTRVMAALGVETPDKALAFFRAAGAEHFHQLRVGVKLPPRPAYYSGDMKLRVVIDRGDVWYDAPYNPATGQERPFPRHRTPTLTLLADVGGQSIPLIRYATTVGGWKTEYRDGKEYYAYKGSDVGPRIWRDIVAGPVWIPPPSTPPRSLVKQVREGGKWVRRVNRDEIGPSYASAYGLVAAYHIEDQRDGKRIAWRDNGIRTHGSVDYMSILTRYSHGCHRLHNHLAMRLFSYILRHSAYQRRGQVPLRYQKKYTVGGQPFEITLSTRGYYYSLRRPIPVQVLEGRILGAQKTPIEHFVRKPGVGYAADDPNLRPDHKVESDAKDSMDGYSPSSDGSPQGKLREIDASPPAPPPRR
jgi:hypothetical protein